MRSPLSFSKHGGWAPRGSSHIPRNPDKTPESLLSHSTGQARLRFQGTRLRVHLVMGEARAPCRRVCEMEDMAKTIFAHCHQLRLPTG